MHRVENFNVHLIQMAGGSQSSNVYEYENDGSKSAESNFVDARENPEGKIPNNQSSKEEVLF